MNRFFLCTVCLFSLVCQSTRLRADFDPIAGWDKQLFPSYIVGTATMKSNTDSQPETLLGDASGLLGVKVVAPSNNARVEVTVSCDGFAEPSTFAGTLPTEGETYLVFPKIKYKYDRMSQCRQATPGTVTYRVQLGEGKIEEKFVTVTFRSINDCPVKVRSGDSILDISYSFATYVNEQHPFVDKLLRESLNIGVVNHFVGYQSENEQEVIRQVYSIWDLMVARDLRYSSITTTAATSDDILSQHVRLLEDTVNNQQANCVDGSVLMVSMLRKIDIESFLVLVPGHCYIGFYADKERTKLYGLETTMVGADFELMDEVDPVIEESVEESLRSDQSWASFVQSLTVGTKNLSEHADKFADPKEAAYKLIDIGFWRKNGVLPIPCHNDEQFVAFDHSTYVSTSSSTSGDDSDDVDGGEEDTDEDDSDEDDSDEDASMDEDE